MTIDNRQLTTDNKKLILGARGSDLAQWQANWVAEQLRRAGYDVQSVVISTAGDRDREAPLNQLGATGVFVKELEEALLARQIDLAVHSLKDMSLDQPEGLTIAAISQRADPADLLIARPEVSIGHGPFGIGENAVVGTSAVRRAVQLRALFPSVETVNLRGNVPTRLARLRDGKFDAIFLAAAGIKRLGIDLGDFSVRRLDPTSFLPSPGQGALAIEMRSDDPNCAEIHRIIDHETTAMAVTIERELLRRFGGGCSLPLGAYARIEGSEWVMGAFWGGDESCPVWLSDRDLNPEALPERIYRRLTAAVGGGS